VGLIITSACSKSSDPVPLGAQKNAVLLAGDKGKSKQWKLKEIDYLLPGKTIQSIPFDDCFLDNVYTFTNNDVQDYAATEGAKSCTTTAPNSIEKGTWVFTLDGLKISIAVDQTYSTNGIFSPEAILGSDGNAYNILTPFPATVKALTATSMVLEISEIVGTSGTVKYTLMFIPI